MNEDKIIRFIAYRSDIARYTIEYYACLVVGMVGIATIFATGSSASDGIYGIVGGMILGCSGFLWSLRSSKAIATATKGYYKQEELIEKARSEQECE